MTEYEFPCYPGDEVWYIENFGGKPLCIAKDTVQMVGFTISGIQIKLRNPHNFNKAYTWKKNVFATQEEAKAAYEKLKHN